MKKQESGSAFQKWFEAQAGKQPMTQSEYLVLKHETIPSIERQLWKAQDKLNEMEQYNTAYKYALYAWTAKDK